MKVGKNKSDDDSIDVLDLDWDEEVVEPLIVARAAAEIGEVWSYGE